jgi:putative component of membrane protein insertase Oxa1/YidC/SpoIIIJ protein YidD
MKYFIILLIKFYWKIIPKNKRNKCLFKESCSRKVYNTTLEKGFLKGIQTLFKRFKQCRFGYRLHYIDSKVKMELIDGTFLNENEINSILLEQFIKIQFTEENK